MIGHNKTPMWVRCLPENYVATALSVLLIANFP
jgi:hypothetical protein